MRSLPMHAVYVKGYPEPNLPNSKKCSLLSVVFLPRELLWVFIGGGGGWDGHVGILCLATSTKIPGSQKKTNKQTGVHHKSYYLYK